MSSLTLATLVLACGAGTVTAATAVKPHLIFMLVDDLGYNGVGYHNSELKTPTIDALATDGVKLDGFYTYKVCAPARASFLTGRFPYKMAATRTNFAYFWTIEGTDLGYTMFPAKLKQAGYSTHMIGKWHQGFYCPEYLPTSRGFDSYFGFLSGCEDHVDQLNCCGPCNVTKYGIGKVIDLFGSTKPAWGFNGTNNGFTFTEHAVDLVASHAAATAAAPAPFMLYMALHNTHAPFQVPAQYSSLYNFSLPLQQTWSGMVSMVDQTVSNVTTALKSAGMWESTLMVMAGDNGSPTAGWGAAGSNAPLRGSKASNWEGGVHTFGFVSGGFLPASQRGQTLSGMVHICDFYKTFVTLAGGDPVDKGGPSPLDSIDQSGYLLGTTAVSPRTVMVHDHFLTGGATGATGAIRVGDWKLLVGPAGFATWFGQFSPNATFNRTAANVVGCKDRPCLFNIKDDPNEHEDLAASQPDQVTKLLAEFSKYDSEFHPGGPKGSDQDGYCKAAAAEKGFMSPWLPGPKVGGGTRALQPGESGEDPILAILRDADDEATGMARVEGFAQGGAW